MSDEPTAAAPEPAPEPATRPSTGPAGGTTEAPSAPATAPHDPQPDSAGTQEAPDRLPTSTAATRDPDDPELADELVAIAPPGKPDGEVDTRPR